MREGKRRCIITQIDSHLLRFDCKELAINQTEVAGMNISGSRLPGAEQSSVPSVSTSLDRFVAIALRTARQ